jgi:hypothetical protein
LLLSRPNPNPIANEVVTSGTCVPESIEYRESCLIRANRGITKALYFNFQSVFIVFWTFFGLDKAGDSESWESGMKIGGEACRDSRTCDLRVFGIGGESRGIESGGVWEVWV